ncbi:hypothetical protein ElyMa_003020300 [Elysia marginata]|uniref:Uncharacterized protein n=1 Tax=Elysia marginata TaxID=1093978 RepID=A0AAV4IHT2_9GAST|nr:hypothetical protein ElyMa_003020300 [Elysia marginata]
MAASIHIELYRDLLALALGVTCPRLSAGLRWCGKSNLCSVRLSAGFGLAPNVELGGGGVTIVNQTIGTCQVNAPFATTGSLPLPSPELFVTESLGSGTLQSNPISRVAVSSRSRPLLVIPATPRHTEPHRATPRRTRR